MINQSKLIYSLDNGLDTQTTQPFEKLAIEIGCSESEVIDSIKQMKNEKKIKRFGIVVKNRSFGFIHNAMVTLDIPNTLVDKIGESIAAYPFVTLCYQRERFIPDWNYNLYFMIHGKDRNLVLQQIQTILKENHLESVNHQILFSRKCLKQKGASYV